MVRIEPLDLLHGVNRRGTISCSLRRLLYEYPSFAGELLQASSLQASFAITMSSTEKSTLVRRWAAEGGSMSWERALSAAHVYDVSSSEDITVVTIDGVASVFEARTGRSLDSTLAGKRVVALAGNAGASKLFAATLADSGAASIYSLKAIDGALTVREVATAAVGSAASFVLVASGPDAATLLATSEDGKSLHVVCAGTDAVAYTIASLRVSAGASGSSGVTVTSIAAVPDASASGGSAVTFVRLSLSDASQLVIAVGATSEGGAGAKAVVSVSASGEVSSEGSAKLPATCASLVVIRYDASPAVVYTAASAGGITHLLRVASDATGGVSATLTALGSVSANGDVTVAGSIGGGAVEAATLKPTLTLPGPLPASDLPSAAGTVAAAFALPFTKQGEAKASLRLLLTLSSGSVVALAPGGAQSPAGKVAWSSPEGDACVTQVLSVDVPKAGYGSDEASAGSSSTSRDPALSLPSRIVSQLAALQAAAPALLASVADRVSRATGRGASGPAGVAAGNKGIIAPGVQIGGLEKVLVFRTRVDGGEAGACAALGATATTATGVLKAVDFESGAQRWALLLPLAPALAALAPAGVKTTVVLSRPRPIQALAAELLVIESHGSTTALTWVNAHTGAVTGSAAYASTASLARVIRTPLLHTGSHREVFALLHADGSAVAAPGGADVGAALIAIKSEFVSVDLQTDEGTGAESVVGVILSPAAAGAAPTARGPQGGAPAVPLMSLTSSALWSVRVSGGAATGERVLAMTASGHSAASGAGSGTSPSSGGVLSTELLSSARTGSGGAAKAERLIQEALAAASGEEAGGSRPVQILGDDSLMLKYVNPHLIAVLVGPAGPVAGAWERRHPRNASAPAPAAASGGQPGLTLTLIDGVTSRVVHTRRHAGASGPCALLRHDNWVIYSYWNARSRRPEVASAALFEGAIDT